jgi:hypothetical protein
LQQLLEPFGITKFYTDGWGAYERHIDTKKHHVGKENTQKIESKHINLRTWMKRLVRRTLCFSKTEQMHDLVIGLFINRYEFGRAIWEGPTYVKHPRFPRQLADRPVLRRGYHTLVHRILIGVKRGVVPVGLRNLGP